MRKTARATSNNDGCDSIDTPTTDSMITANASEKTGPRSLERPASGTWKERLITDEKGDPRPLLANCKIALEQAPGWEGVLAYDEFRGWVVTKKAALWQEAPSAEWTDQDDRLTADWLQHQGIFVSVDVAGQAVRTVAQGRLFHSLREELNSLVWDGKKRLETWLSDCVGAPDNGDTRRLAFLWMVSAIRRVFEPGVGESLCLVLEGGRDSEASQVFEILGGRYYTDEIAVLGKKDSSFQTMGVWIIELALNSMSRSEINNVEEFVTRRADRVRPSYGAHYLIKSPRQCIFGATATDFGYFHPDIFTYSGFFAIECGLIDFDKLAKQRDQLLAEAVHAYLAGNALKASPARRRNRRIV